MPERQNPIVNRLNKTKVETEVDHEQERVERLRVEANQRRAAAAEKVLESHFLVPFLRQQLTLPMSKPCRNAQMLNWRSSGKLRSRPNPTIPSSILHPARSRQRAMTFGTMKGANLMRLGPRSLRISSEKLKYFRHFNSVYICLIAIDTEFSSVACAFGVGSSYNYSIARSSETKSWLFSSIKFCERFAIQSK